MCHIIHCLVYNFFYLKLQRIITVRNSSCGKVMFSQVSVCPRGVYTPMARQTPPGQRSPLRADGHCSGWYASYCNAFLFK